MEYIYGLRINNVVKNLKRIALPIKTYKQIFVFYMTFAVIKPTIVYCSIKSPSNIRFAHVMFESRRIELNGNVHIFTIVLVSVQVNSGTQAQPPPEKSGKLHNYCAFNR